MLPKKHRLQKSGFSKETFSNKRFHNSNITLFIQIQHTAAPPRFAFVAGSNVSKEAHTRNKLKRRARAVLGRKLHKLRTGHTGVFVFKKGSELYSYDELERHMVELLKRAGFLHGEVKNKTNGASDKKT